MNLLLIWELPRTDKRYVIPVDVSNGLQQDRHSMDVLRVGDLFEPDEQVAHFVSDDVDPIDLAGVIDTVGRFYAGPDGQALVAIEVNGPGLATQSELMRHFGYENLFIWQHEDSADPQRRLTTRVGWETNKRTRPIMVTRLVKMVKTIDPTTHQPDLKINSPLTRAELRDFQTLGAVWEAEADTSNPDATDDCIMSLAIGAHVCQTLHFEEGEPLDMKRRRLAAQEARKQQQAEKLETRRDWINTEYTADEMRSGMEDQEEYDDVQWWQ